MSEKDRQKKDGQDKNKKNRRMREDISCRHQTAAPREKESTSKGEDRGQREKRVGRRQEQEQDQ